MIMEKIMNTKMEGNTFTKKIGQTVYVVCYHFNEEATETMKEKINQMLAAKPIMPVHLTGGIMSIRRSHWNTATLRLVSSHSKHG